MIYPIPRPAVVVTFGLLFLAACADPATRCTGPEARELRTINQLIVETRADIDRGYRLETRDSNAGINLCLGGRQSHVGVSFCTDPGQRRQPVALDNAAETRKLDALMTRRTALLTTIAQRQASCTP